MGTQILYDAGYDPRGMAQFFEKLEAQSRGKNAAEFFSDHPNPEHRIGRVDDEIEKLGGPPANAQRDSAEFHSIRREMLALTAVRGRPGVAASGGGRPPSPSTNFTLYQGRVFSLKFPDNWKVSGEGAAPSFAPDGGLVPDRNGNQALAYGMLVSLADPRGDPNAPNALEESTDRLIDELKHSNPGMRLLRKPERIRLNGQRAVSTYMSNDSPLGGQETDWVVTVLRPEGLLYYICVAPQAEYSDYDKTFANILDSVRFAR